MGEAPRLLQRRRARESRMFVFYTKIKFSVLRLTDASYIFYHRTPRDSNRQGLRIPHRASSTHPPPQTTSLCTHISARSSPFRTTKRWTPSSPTVACETRGPRPPCPLRHPHHPPPKAGGGGGGEGGALARAPPATYTRAIAARPRSRAETRALSHRHRKEA